MEEWFLLVNPAAGGFKAEKQWPGIAEKLKKAGLHFQPAVSKSSSHAIQLVNDAATSGYTKFIALGGDGTLNMLVNGIFQQKPTDPKSITVAIIPIGTGNDWIRTQKIPRSIDKAIEIIRIGKTVFHDIGFMRLRGNPAEMATYFINMAGFGFQGFVAERIEGAASKFKKGTSAFVFGIFDALFRYKETDMMIQLDGKEIEGAIYNMNAAICKYCGGGMKMAPAAITDDGLFDITIIRKIGKVEVVANVPRLFNGSFVGNKKVSQHRARKLSILSDPLAPAECDGEVLGYGNAELEILEKAIKVIVP